MHRYLPGQPATFTTAGTFFANGCVTSTKVCPRAKAEFGWQPRHADLDTIVAGGSLRVGNELMLGEHEVRRTGQRGYCCNLASAQSGLMDAQGQLWLATRDGVLRIDTARGEASVAQPRRAQGSSGRAWMSAPPTARGSKATHSKRATPT